MGIISKIILVSLIIIISIISISFYLINQEIKDARNFCNDLNGNYSFNLYGGNHYCNKKLIGKFSMENYDLEFWDFYENIRSIDYNSHEINLSNINKDK